MVNNGEANAFAAYGALKTQHLEQAERGSFILKQPVFPRQRMKLNVVAIFISLFVPWMLFCSLYGVVAFRLHYKMAGLCWGLVALGVVIALGFGVMAGLNIMELVKGSPAFRPQWYIFLFLTSLVAVTLGPVLGNRTYWQHSQPYYDLVNLNDYTAVDPSRMRGQQMMDAGRVQFLKGAQVDIRKAYAFQNLDTYCVAPISLYNPAMGTDMPLASYDFWAVGINCCGNGNSTSSVDFKCGAYKSNTAQDGLRLVADDKRDFFRLAVQQAEAAHMITAAHPLFFSFVDDATASMNEYLELAFRNFAYWMIGFFLVQLALVSALSCALSKSGYDW